ncbi:MAG TPA: sulfite oxidase [Egibacteraceae bacterium]
MTTQTPNTGHDVIAPPGAGVSQEELALAARNHGMPLEALRHDLTPVGLHYLLIHFDIPPLDETTWRLHVGGCVGRPLTLSLADLQARETVTLPVTMECAGNGRARLEPRPVSQPWLHEAVGTAEWTGTPLRGVLEEAGLADDAVEVCFTGHDRGVQGGVEHDYARSLPLAEALGDDVLLAWGVNGQPLPPQHGYPLRLLVPGWYGMTSVKWLRDITVLDRPFDGYQQAVAYQFQPEVDGPAEPVTRIAPRALVIPPGIPDFLTRRRHLSRGAVTLRGRAWSGTGEVVAVEVSTDGGATWHTAELGASPGRWAWRPWTWTWQAEPGEHEIVVRARDDSGAAQPLEQRWNVQGMANNAVQRVPVTVA